MQIGELNGKLVLLKFSDEIVADLPLFQIYKDEAWAVVTGVDDVGVWIQNSGYELGIWWDQEGNLIPPGKQVKEKVKTNILIPWRYIKAMMTVDDARFQKTRDERLPGFQAYR
ncbi:MAG: hypothetical protein PHS09_04325 [Candidatus Omnitrophica bacterium]|jgi:hypothetical protein|nr:hypothetical protein [Candidatus Omnitrophota bacterium]MDD5513347.1 hypothetical protein [Candidatus Omnitrophota bacterium]